jgi:dipeptidase E
MVNYVSDVSESPSTCLNRELRLASLDRRSAPPGPKEEIRTKRDSAPYAPAMSRPRQILALGGGGFSMEAGNALLDDHALALTGAACPKVCFLPTASGDADHYIVRFYRAFPAGRCEPSHVSLFRRDCGTDDVRAHLLSQDLVYVGGGSVICLMGVLRAHGLDVALREAWEAGVVLCGLSAGSLCWFAEAMTGYHGASRPVEGLGLIPGSNAVHYDKEPHRRPAYHAAVGGGMPGGYAAEDGAALHFTGTELNRAVASRPQAGGYRLEAVGERVVEMRVKTAYLGDGR